MNYLLLIKNFWLQHKLYGFNCPEIVLYYYLLEINNLGFWEGTFTRNNAKTRLDLGISSIMLSNARKRLKKVGLIDYKTSGGSAVTIYRLLPPKQDPNKEE